MACRATEGFSATTRPLVLMFDGGLFQVQPQRTLPVVRVEASSFHRSGGLHSLRWFGPGSLGTVPGHHSLGWWSVGLNRRLALYTSWFYKDLTRGAHP